MPKSAEPVTTMSTPTTPPVKGSFWRSVPFQVIVACGVSFTAVGMWDALGGLGAGGAAEPYAVSAANAVLYGLFTFVCIIAGVVNNRIGLRYGLAIGAIGYPLYGAGLYTNNYQANTWFLLFGAAACGISAGFYYAAEAAIIIGYPSPHERAFYLAIWATAKAAGPIVGGAINLGTNVERNFAGTISSTTYIIFLVIMCMGLPIALLLSPAEKVWRKDGTRVVVRLENTWKNEFLAMLKLFLSRRILMLLPAFFISYFYLGFQSTWQTQYFTVRARALSSFLLFWSHIFISFLLAAILDRQSIHIKTRARLGFMLVITIMIATWIWAIILQKQFYDSPTKVVLDWDDSRYPAAFLLSFFWYFGGQGFQQYLYWLVGQYSVNISSLSHHTGILRGVEALGQTIAWAMQANKSSSHFISIGMNFGLTVFCIVPTWIIISELEFTHEEQVVDGATIGSKEEEDMQLEKGANPESKALNLST